jgi:hypothetical protein
MGRKGEGEKGRRGEEEKGRKGEGENKINLSPRLSAHPQRHSAVKQKFDGEGRTDTEKIRRRH